MDPANSLSFPAPHLRLHFTIKLLLPSQMMQFNSVYLKMSVLYLDNGFHLLCKTFRLSLQAPLLFRCPKGIAGTQIRTFVKENLITNVHGQVICHREFATENVLVCMGLNLEKPCKRDQAQKIEISQKSIFFVV